MSIEGIALEHFSASPKSDFKSSTISHQRHAVFHYFYLTIANRMLPLLQHTANYLCHFSRTKILTTSLSTIWENTDGCAEQYRFTSALYLMSVMSQCYSILIDRGISAPGHGKEVVYGLNAVDNRYIYQLMSKVQLPGLVIFDLQIKIHTGTENKDVILSQEFKNNLEEEHIQNCDIGQVKSK